MYEEIINNVEPEIFHQEPVSGGYRPLKKRYIHQQGVLIEEIIYNNTPNSDGWADIKNIIYREAQNNEISIYRTWNISNYNNLYRTVNLTKLEVTATQIKVYIVIKHYLDENKIQIAQTEDKFTILIGEDDFIINVDSVFVAQGYPAQMGERSYWDLLTNAGFTPYQLLDTRIPELDNVGRFNLIYG